MLFQIKINELEHKYVEQQKKLSGVHIIDESDDEDETEEEIKINYDKWKLKEEPEKKDEPEPENVKKLRDSLTDFFQKMEDLEKKRKDKKNN